MNTENFFNRVAFPRNSLDGELTEKGNSNELILHNPPIPMSIEGRQGHESLIASKDRGPWCFKASLEDFEGFSKSSIFHLNA